MFLDEDKTKEEMRKHKRAITIFGRPWAIGALQGGQMNSSGFSLLNHTISRS